MKKTARDMKPFLPLVRKPSRYVGGEVNSVVKDHSAVRVTFGLCFPDAYEVGMSHLGLQILYHALNSRDDIACERAFAPWPDMEELLREKDAPLATLEKNTPLSDLHVVGFSLQYELSFTNVLQMLELGGIPLGSRDRAESDPIVIAGGPAAFNPEPVADFLDAVLIGDGEEAAVEMALAVAEGREKGEKRADILKRLAGIRGVYVPSFFDVEYNGDGTVKRIAPLVEGYEKVQKRVLTDLETAPFPTRPVVPYTEVVHDRYAVEIARGCTRGCRFCQAGMIYRPARERRPATIARLMEEGLENTGYDEVSLLSLSTGDYTNVEALLATLMKRFTCDHVAVSLPSLRVGTLSRELASEIVKVRKTGFTLAPEAGTERLREVVNKGITEDDLLTTARTVCSLGWRAMKLYFMTGLPTETEEDLQGIVELARKVKKAGREGSKRSPKVNVSAATFIPKPMTPFQWEPQITAEEARDRLKYLRSRMKDRNMGFKWHNPEMSLLEGVFSRGDRRLSGVIERAFRKGCRFDGWTDEVDFDAWWEALKEEDLDPAFYAYRRRAPEEVFPWDHIDCGVTSEFLREEYEKALEGTYTPDCKVGRCTDCGVCDHRVVKNVPVKKGDSAPAPPESGAGDERGSYKVRLGFTKAGELRHLSHHELVNTIIRTVRRAGLNLKYSGGFHPKPKISPSPPLPVGVASTVEGLEMELVDRAGVLAAEDIAERLNSVAPGGLKFTAPEQESLKLPPPSAIIDTAEYIISVKDAPEGLNIDSGGIDGLVRHFNGLDSAPARIRKKEKFLEVDIKQSVEELSVTSGSDLRLRLRRVDGVNVRPLDLLVCLFGLSREDASLIPVTRTGPSVVTSARQ